MLKVQHSPPTGDLGDFCPSRTGQPDFLQRKLRLRDNSLAPQLQENCRSEHLQNKMALALGKRKRTQDVSNRSQKVKKDDGSDDEDAIARALFQRAFEKKFKPLPKTEKPANQDDTPSSGDDDEDDDEDDDSENSGSELSENDDDDGWSGISENEDSPQPAKPQLEVIEDRTFSKPLTAEEKRLKKQFMTAKIPSTPKFPIPHKPSAATAVSTKADPDGEGQDGTDNLQNDLALQRLLKESHLLDSNTFSANGSGSSAPEGAARLRALDMRIRDLGGKKSHMDQERMPIAFRKGMVAKAGQREDKRRTEAKENGIILERFGAKSAGGGGAGAATRGGGKERKRGGVIGIGGPDVGTYRGATLRLSKNDIKGIEGSGKRGGKGGRGGGRGGKRKGPAKFGSGV